MLGHALSRILAAMAAYHLAGAEDSCYPNGEYYVKIYIYQGYTEEGNGCSDAIGSADPYYDVTIDGTTETTSVLNNAGDSTETW